MVRTKVQKRDRAYETRVKGLMKKMNELSALTGAKVTFIAEYDNCRHTFETGENATGTEVTQHVRYGPDDFDTVKSRQLRERMASLSQTSYSTPSEPGSDDAPFECLTLPQTEQSGDATSSAGSSLPWSDQAPQQSSPAASSLAPRLPKTKSKKGFLFTRDFFG